MTDYRNPNPRFWRHTNMMIIDLGSVVAIGVVRTIHGLRTLPVRLLS